MPYAPEGGYGHWPAPGAASQEINPGAQGAGYDATDYVLDAIDDMTAGAPDTGAQPFSEQDLKDLLGED